MTSTLIPGDSQEVIVSTTTVEVDHSSRARRRLAWIAALAIAASTAALVSNDTSALDPATPDEPTQIVGSGAAGGRLTFR